MSLDAATASVMAALAVGVAGVVYIATSLVRRDSGGARLWALSFLLAIVGVLCFAVPVATGAAGAAASWALAIGNAAVVGASGCILLGFRAFNGSQVQGPALLIAALAFLTGVATVLETPRYGEWGGALFMFLSIGALATGGAIHALGARTRGFLMARLFAAALVVQASYYLARSVVLLVAGTDGALFTDWFGVTATSVFFVSFGLVMAIAMFTLRAALSGEPAVFTGPSASADILSADAFASSLREVLHRAASRLELVVVIAVRVEDLGAITASFGHEVSDETTRVLRRAVREFSSSVAIVGESTDRTVALVASTASSPADARRQAGLLYRGVVQRFIGQRGIVVPGVGVGVALSQTLGYTAEALIEGAASAAVQAAESDEMSVVFATVRVLRADPFPAAPQE